jgi:carbamoyl-phosphate synthase large subunit
MPRRDDIKKVLIIGSGRELRVCGVMNIQYAICQDKVYVLEANPRASRTVPLVSKVCAIPMARIATPEMRSTGEVLGMATTFDLAYFKSQQAAGGPLPLKSTVLISVTDKDKPLILEAARKFTELGFHIKATAGTYEFLRQNKVPCERTYKILEHLRPNIADEINSRAIDPIINTPKGKASALDDAYIRKSAIKYKVPYVTTTAAAKAAIAGIAAARSVCAGVKSLQSYHQEIGI